MIPVQETEKRGLVPYEGNIEAVHPGEKTVVLQGWVLPKRITDPRPVPRPYTFTILPNTKIIRSSAPASLKDLNPRRTRPRPRAARARWAAADRLAERWQAARLSGRDGRAR